MSPQPSSESSEEKQEQSKEELLHDDIKLEVLKKLESTQKALIENNQLACKIDRDDIYRITKDKYVGKNANKRNAAAGQAKAMETKIAQLKNKDQFKEMKVSDLVKQLKVWDDQMNPRKSMFSRRNKNWASEINNYIEKQLKSQNQNKVPLKNKIKKILTAASSLRR